MNAIKVIRENGNVSIAIDLCHLHDAMSVEDRKELVGTVCEDEAFLHTVCAAVATDEQWAKMKPSYDDHDHWWGEATKSRLRAALIPLLPEIMAEELRKAIETSDKCKRAHDQLRTLCHVEQMIRDTEKWTDLSQERSRQWQHEWTQAQQMFPEFLTENQS